MKKILTVLTFLVALLFASQVFATSEKDITFPVAELGGCKNEAECRAFCDKPENKMSPCFPFAKKYNLLTKEELDRAERFTKIAVAGGPGWCRTDGACSVEVFCNDFAHLDQCLDFAQENGFASQEELADARKVAEGMKKGANPPGNCRGDNECNIYCAMEGNWQECAKWSNDIGIPPRLSPEAQKFVDLIKSGKSAGGCQTKTACESYCADPNHKNECLDMALTAGFITGEEAELAKKYGGAGPGGCKSEQDCSAFCQQPYNQRVCLAFANDHGIKTDFQGPGGCSDVSSCTAYCTKNQSDTECKKYSSKYQGFKGPGGCEDEASCKNYCQSNPSNSECKQYSGQYGGFSGPGGCSDVGSCTGYCKDHYQDAQCQKYSSQYGGGFSGPGGCSSESSCKAYCTANSQDAACKQMASQYGGFSGPGGCTSVDECKAKCQSNPQDSECQKYAGQYGGFSGPGGCSDVASCTSYCKSNPKDSACAQYAGQYGGGQSDQMQQQQQYQQQNQNQNQQ